MCVCVCCVCVGLRGFFGGEVGRVLGLELGGCHRLAWRGQAMKVWETANWG